MLPGEWPPDEIRGHKVHRTGQNPQGVLSKCGRPPLSRKPSQNASAPGAFLRLPASFLSLTGLLIYLLGWAPQPHCMPAPASWVGCWGEELLRLWRSRTGPSRGGEQLLNARPSTPFSTRGCLAQHFLHGFPVAVFQGLLSAPGPYKGSFDEKFEGK